MPVLAVRSTAQLKCIYTNARSMGNKQEELEAIVQQDRAMTWSPSQKRGGTARMTGMLSWMATDSLGKTGQQGKVMELLCM